MFSISLQIPQENIDSLSSDYDLLKTMFEDEIHEVSIDENTLNFLIKLKYEIIIQESIYDLLEELKFTDLIINYNLMYLPYWIRFSFTKETRVLKMDFFIYWIKKRQTIINEIYTSIESIEEPYLYNAIDSTKATIENSLDTDGLLNLLTEIREMIVINRNISTDNFLLKLTGANKDLDGFQYQNKEIFVDEINKKEEEEKKNENNKEKFPKKEDLYQKFFAEGGVTGETIIDRASVFQAHAIVIKSKQEVDKYKRYLLSQRKIKRATHNISAYRFFDKKRKLTIEDYDDDGEEEAGIRLLGILQKMKITNVLLVVSRWFGGILLHHDRFKRINDVAIILLNNYSNKFKLNLDE